MNMQQKMKMLALLNEMQSIILNENVHADANKIRTPLDDVDEEEKRALENTSGLREKASQYDWQATSSAYGMETENPVDSVMSEEKISSEFYGPSGSYNGFYSRTDTSGMSSMSSLPSLKS